MTIFHYRVGRWRFVTAGGSFVNSNGKCGVPHVPKAVSRTSASAAASYSPLEPKLLEKVKDPAYRRADDRWAHRDHHLRRRRDLADHGRDGPELWVREGLSVLSRCSSRHYSWVSHSCLLGVTIGAGPQLLQPVAPRREGGRPSSEASSMLEDLGQ